MEPKEPVRASEVVLRLIQSLKPSFTRYKVQCLDTAAADQEWVDQEGRSMLAESELWRADLSWSCEAQTLRAMAIAAPDKLTEAVGHQTVQHLRITDKQVTEVDPGMAAYVNLKELTLTGNYISTVASHNLPTGLKVLELCYNRLCDTEALNKATPPELQHLGVAYNQLAQLCMTPQNWKYLVSLDLSYNLLCDLSATAEVLVRLHSLRTLQLKGNPLALVPCYRSYVTDSLSKLMRLDDADITVNDQQTASSMRTHCELHTYLTTTSELEMSIAALSGVPMLEAIPDTSDVATRYTLHFVHSFVPESAIVQSSKTKCDQSQNIPSIAFNGLQDQHTALTDQKYFQVLTPVLINPESFQFNPIMACYVVQDLENLVTLLKEGMDMNLVLSKVVYIRDGADESSLEFNGRASAAAGKTGQATAQSGKQSALSKKDGAAATAAAKKPVKKKAGTQGVAGLPGEGWHVSATQVESFTLATLHIDTAALLEAYQLVVDQTTRPFMFELQRKGILESGSDVTDTENETTQLDSIKLQVQFRLKQFSSVYETCAPRQAS